jgi:hypothetical protein
MSDSFKDRRCMLQDRTSLSLGLQRRCYAVRVEVGESVDDVETSLPNRGVTLPIQSEHNGYQAMSRDGSSCPDVSQFGSCERYRLLAGLKGGDRRRFACSSEWTRWSKCSPNAVLPLNARTRASTL